MCPSCGHARTHASMHANASRGLFVGCIIRFTAPEIVWSCAPLFDLLNYWAHGLGTLWDKTYTQTLRAAAAAADTIQCHAQRWITRFRKWAEAEHTKNNTIFYSFFSIKIYTYPTRYRISLCAQRNESVCTIPEKNRHSISCIRPLPPHTSGRDRII